jgi:hypothetical protein
MESGEVPLPEPLTGASMYSGTTMRSYSRESLLKRKD